VSIQTGKGGSVRSRVAWIHFYGHARHGSDRHLEGTKAMIEIKHLTKQFGEFVAVNDISLEIKKGETFALLGPNGSGKTTTLKCLVGLAVPTAGEITIHGFDVWKKSREARRLISYLPQRVNFHDTLTAREVLEFYCRLRKIAPRRIDGMLDGSRFDFNGFGDRPVSEFSGGMIQRLGLAVACLPDAPILILDEPTISLDPEGAMRFREFLLSLKREGKTILFSSHMLADVEQLADRVAILVGGKLVALESIEVLRDGLMRHCKMRVILLNARQYWVEVALRAGAKEVTLQRESLWVISRPEDRLNILRAIEAAGGQIGRFTTQELSLEEVYLRYVNGSD
jgi:ABC-type multidrug transport system ATPase subunit